MMGSENNGSVQFIEFGSVQFIEFGSVQLMNCF